MFLPPELWNNIFKKMFDIRKIAILRLVSRYFNEIIINNKSTSCKLELAEAGKYHDTIFDQISWACEQGKIDILKFILSGKYTVDLEQLFIQTMSSAETTNLNISCVYPKGSKSFSEFNYGFKIGSVASYLKHSIFPENGKLRPLNSPLVKEIFRLIINFFRNELEIFSYSPLLIIQLFNEMIVKKHDKFKDYSSDYKQNLILDIYKLISAELYGYSRENHINYPIFKEKNDLDFVLLRLLEFFDDRKLKICDWLVDSYKLELSYVMKKSNTFCGSILSWACLYNNLEGCKWLEKKFKLSKDYALREDKTFYDLDVSLNYTRRNNGELRPKEAIEIENWLKETFNL